LVDEIATDGRRLGELLRDRARCTFSWVLLPETLALEETWDAVAALTTAGLAVDEVVVNRITPPPPTRCPTCEARMRAEDAVIGAAREAFPDRRLRRVPAQACEPRGLAALRIVGRALTDGVGVVAPSRPRRRGARAPRLGKHGGGRPVALDALVPAAVRL